MTLLVSAFGAQILSAQELPNMPGAVKEHEWLKKFVGQWDVVSEGSAGEGRPPIKGKAVMNSSMLGELWVVNSSDFEIAGMNMKSIQLIGYDTNKKKYVGIWADSMFNHATQIMESISKAVRWFLN
jgi:hypothetical protein